ncbi:MAG: hypothetical protein AAF149_04705 [Bacteroidota bacterium]
MELRDLIITPTYIFLIGGTLYFFRHVFAPKPFQKYLFPAFILKVFGAIALGLVYQFYYGGGDTFGFTTYGASYIWEAFLVNPLTGLKLIFLENEYQSDTFRYASRMWYFDDPSSYFVVRVAGIFSLVTFNTYSAIAVIFASVSFLSMWMLFVSLCKIYPDLNYKLFFSLFFIPSVIFWGSGVLKDTLTLSALSLVVYSFINVFIFNKNQLLSTLLLLGALLVLFKVKIYILISLVPALLIWLFSIKIKKISNTVLKIVLAPVVFFGFSVLGLLLINQITQGSDKYSMSSVLTTIEVTAKDNSMWTVRQDGSGYNLGDYDFSVRGVILKFFPAIWVSLFRPYLWEANSPIMLFSALESFTFLILTFYFFLRNKLKVIFEEVRSDPFIIFCFVFSLTFAFAVGISSGNFGSLVRYKIPLMPFYLIGLLLLNSKLANRTD